MPKPSPLYCACCCSLLGYFGGDDAVKAGDPADPIDDAKKHYGGVCPQCANTTAAGDHMKQTRQRDAHINYAKDGRKVSAAPNAPAKGHVYCNSADEAAECRKEYIEKHVKPVLMEGF